MSEEQVRVACPACGKRFRLDPDSVPEGGTGKTSRCSGCGTPFVVLRAAGEVRAEPLRKRPVRPRKPAWRRNVRVPSRFCRFGGKTV